MKQVYVTTDPLEVQLLCDHLKGSGVDAVVQGLYLVGAWGEIPVNSYPAVWVINDDDYDRALRIIEEIKASNSKTQVFKNAWICPKCGENIEPQFTQCWNCGQERS